MEVAHSHPNNRLGNYKLNSFTYILLVFKSHSIWVLLNVDFSLWKTIFRYTSQNENQTSNFHFYKFVSSLEGFYKNRTFIDTPLCGPMLQCLCTLLSVDELINFFIWGEIRASCPLLTFKLALLNLYLRRLLYIYMYCTLNYLFEV